MVDGIAVPGHGLRAFRVLPYIKYSTIIPGGLTNTSFSLLINGKKWAGLSKTQQDQVNSVSGIKVSELAGNVDKAAAGGLKALEEKGGKVIMADPSLVAAIRKFGVGAEAEWMKKASAEGIDAKASMAYFKSQLK